MSEFTGPINQLALMRCRCELIGRIAGYEACIEDAKELGDMFLATGYTVEVAQLREALERLPDLGEGDLHG